MNEITPTQENEIVADDVVNEAAETIASEPYAAEEAKPLCTYDVYAPDDIMSIYNPDAAGKFASDLTAEILSGVEIDLNELKSRDYGFILPAVNYAGNIANYRQWPQISTNAKVEELLENKEALEYFSKILATTGYFVVVSTEENATNEWKDTIDVPTNIGMLAVTSVGRFEYAYAGITIVAVAYMFDSSNVSDAKLAQKVAVIKKSQLKSQLLHYNGVFNMIPQQTLDQIIDGLFSDHRVLFNALTPGLFVQVIRRRTSGNNGMYDADKNCRVRINNNNTTLSSAQYNEASTYYELMGVKMQRPVLIARVQLVRLRYWLYSQKEVQDELARIRNNRN